MKIKSGTIIWLILCFLWSIFMGITAVSIGLGSLFPTMNIVAQPFVCPGGQMELHTQHYQDSPTESGSVLYWYCVDHRAETKTELNPFLINFYAGPFYGLLIFIVLLLIWYFNSKWDPSKASEAAKKRMAWLQAIVITAIVVIVTLFSLMPLFDSIATSFEPTPTPNATATALAVTYQTLTSGNPETFNATEKPLANWNGVPIMPQAVTGQQAGKDRYQFKVPVDTGTIETFYTDGLKPLGWSLQDSRWLGMKFTKGSDILLVTLAPNSDLESFIVTLVLVP